MFSAGLQLQSRTRRQGEQTHAASSSRHHPAVAITVAYALFLLGRGALSPEANASRRRGRALRGHGAQAGAESEEEDALDVVSDLRMGGRDVCIVTTAAMPWMTGTAVNPVLRAAYLRKRGHRVVLFVPWVEREQQVRIWGGNGFEGKEQQRREIMEWGKKEIGEDVGIRVEFYEGVYHEGFGSILPVGSITETIEKCGIKRDVCVLEEPEHLTWHHVGKVWTEVFRYVVGIIHTNYIEYAKNWGAFGNQLALALLFLNVWVCRGYCHRIIKLSDAVQQFHGSITSNVHGVRRRFIQVGKEGKGGWKKGAYFMGKVLWAKGYRELVDNMTDYHQRTGDVLDIDFFGAGPDVEDVQKEIQENAALRNVKFSAKVADPLSEELKTYKVFVNPSSSDVVCTATAEALAMGKLVVCLEHPSNEFFSTFDNCTTYQTSTQFAQCVQNALLATPKPLSQDDAYRLTWNAATDRLYDAMRLPPSKRKPSRMDRTFANVHEKLCRIYPQPGMTLRKERSRRSLQQAEHDKDE